MRLLLLPFLLLSLLLPRLALGQLSGVETYDTSEKMILGAVDRARYYMSYSYFDRGMGKEEFLAQADRSRGVVVYAHGCGREANWDREARKLYLELGYYFVDADFISRGDTAASCSLRGKEFVYRTNVHERLKARDLEISAHVNFLRKSGFEKIVAAGFSEGGMVMQLLSAEVSAVVVHSMMCVPLQQAPNPKNKTLRVVSRKDPILMPRWGILMLCEDHPWYSHYENVVSEVASHSPAADPKWQEAIGEFLRRNGL